MRPELLRVDAGSRFKGWAAAGLGQLHEFDSDRLRWRTLGGGEGEAGGPVHGAQPPAIKYFGFAAANGSLFVLGGYSDSGMCVIVAVSSQNRSNHDELVSDRCCLRTRGELGCLKFLQTQYIAYRICCVSYPPVEDLLLRRNNSAHSLITMGRACCQ
jgi:hypothetical protein